MANQTFDAIGPSVAGGLDPPGPILGRPPRLIRQQCLEAVS
ncbi:hypothetical protein [Belnapia moabensis]|nr:hypothetical protein [Belnapia moabensis]